MAIKPEALEKWLEDHTLENRQKGAATDMDAQRRKAERRRELIDQLLKEAWGRELWHDIIADAGVLKENAMTGNAQSYYILGKQVVAKHNMDWVEQFHFDEYIKMKQEARRRDQEANNE